MHILEAQHLNTLVEVLRRRGYTVVAPTIRDGAIVLGNITTAEELPRGWTDDQDPAHYELARRKDAAYFGYAVGPHSWKQFLYPSRLKLFTATKMGKGFDVQSEEPDGFPPLAFLGVRPCELTAIQLQDKVFRTGSSVDPFYNHMREKSLMVCVNCTQPAATCFCTSMGSGPGAEKGFDLVLTEVVDDGVHHFVVRADSPLGAGVVAELPTREAGEAEIGKADRLVAAAASSMARSVDTDHLPQVLNENFDAPHWEEIAKRCLACANCTMVCPTCFCSTVEDTTNLTGGQAERWRRWDSCYTSDFTKIAGGNIRMSTRTRYRQWLMHKFAHWVDQFGAFGCVGCGRCITWCPVGIDVTVELRAFREQLTARTAVKKV
jgi:sulfhydrogenase subunit beta (sulfur reductase)